MKFTWFIAMLLSFSLLAKADLKDWPLEVYETDDQISIVINGNEVQSMDQLQESLKIALHLPEYYGKNLDALYDVLTDPQLTPKGASLVIVEAEIMKAHLGTEAVEKLVDTLNEAHEQRPTAVELTYWQ
jgi:ribonuclease inhibitor